MRPRPMAAAIVAGMSAVARRWHTCWKEWLAAASSNNSLAISAVRPLGPGAAPFLARAKLVRKSWAGMAAGVAGFHCNRSVSMAWYACWGLAVGSVRRWWVASSPGARGSASSAWRARDSSPRRVKWIAR